MPNLPRVSVITLFLATNFAPALCAQEPDAETLKFVESKVRPLLEARCFECHASSSKEVKGGLLLDSFDAILQGGESGPAVVPKKPDESLLIEAVRYEGFEMPPRSKLPAGEIAILEKWVALGAPLPGKSTAAIVKPEPFPLKQRMADHWSWAPIRKHTVPEVKQSDWANNDIDRFLLAKLESQGLTPAKRADRRTLARRLYFDIIGLPPTPDQLRAFTQNPKDDQDAIAELADELLASPHFGERWGRHWLDLTRYAESYGHEFDYPLHHAHEYRDYVIRALNADVPYDQFATEHIAGDLVQPPRLHPKEGFNESLIGTGFWYLGEGKHAPVDVRAEEATTIDNQIDVFSKTFLGLTVACARCHDHKFDAISAKDYYALSGLLQSSIRQVGMLDPGSRIANARKEMERIRSDAEKVLADAMTESLSELTPDSIRKWAEENKNQALQKVDNPLFLLATTATVSEAAFATELGKSKERIAASKKAADNSRKDMVQFASFENGLPANWSYVGEAFESDPVTDGTEWDWTSDAPKRLSPGYANSRRNSSKFQGVLRSPVFELQHDTILYSTIANDARLRLVIEGFRMDAFNALLFNGAKVDVKTTDGKEKWLRHVGDIRNHKGRRCHLEITDTGNGQIAVKEILFANRGEPQPAPAKASTEILKRNPNSLQELVEATRAIAKQGANGGSVAATELLNAMLEHGLVSAKSASQQLATVKTQLTELDKRINGPRKVIAISDGPAENERLFIRGSHTNLGDVVPRRLLEAFDSPEINKQFGSGRLQIAKQMFGGANPYPARVMANRIWHHIFGRGIVASTDNFGVLGQKPTHPELLDHLATAFSDSDGWSIKRFIKRLVTTQAYQMTSQNPAGSKADPQNLLLHRAPIKRLQGEAIRDALLTISGRLNTKQFGPAVPVHLTSFMQGRGRPRNNGPLDGDGRRSIYIKINRNFLSPFMLAFDSPIPSNTIGRRSNSNVPAQALILLNDPFVAQQAEVWAKRLIDEHAAPESRIVAMYESAFGRTPDGRERQLATDFVKSLAGDNWLKDVEAWKDLCHVLINTKEFIYVN